MLVDLSARVGVEAVIPHPCYGPEDSLCDIAVIKLVHPISFATNMKLAQLPTDLHAKPKQPQKCVSAGGGMMNESNYFNMVCFVRLISYVKLCLRR